MATKFPNTFWWSGKTVEGSRGFTAESYLTHMNAMLCVLGGEDGDERLLTAMISVPLSGAGSACASATRIDD